MTKFKVGDLVQIDYGLVNSNTNKIAEVNGKVSVVTKFYSAGDDSFVLDYVWLYGYEGWFSSRVIKLLNRIKD